MIYETKRHSIECNLRLGRGYDSRCSVMVSLCSVVTNSASGYERIVDAQKNEKFSDRHLLHVKCNLFGNWIAS